jgi:hypothetical protein
MRNPAQRRRNSDGKRTQGKAKGEGRKKTWTPNKLTQPHSKKGGEKEGDKNDTKGSFPSCE